jgi:hypothetical protein
MTQGSKFRRGAVAVEKGCLLAPIIVTCLLVITWVGKGVQGQREAEEAAAAAEGRQLPPRFEDTPLGKATSATFWVGVVIFVVVAAIKAEREERLFRNPPPPQKDGQAPQG